MTILDWAQPELEKNEATSNPGTTSGVQVLAATFGGLIVTEKIRELCTEDGTMDIEMGRMVYFLAPDPFGGHEKTLTVLYKFEGEDALYLLNAPETSSGRICISRTGSPSMTIQRLDTSFKRAPFLDVEIIAAVWGPKRVKTPSVLLRLAQFFSDRDYQHQIRMTNDFWKEDTWPGKHKTWTVYFKFTGSGRVQCVAGLEGQALEVPWSRHI